MKATPPWTYPTSITPSRSHSRPSHNPCSKHSSCTWLGSTIIIYIDLLRARLLWHWLSWLRLVWVRCYSLRLIKTSSLLHHWSGLCSSRWSIASRFHLLYFRIWNFLWMRNIEEIISCFYFVSHRGIRFAEIIHSELILRFAKLIHDILFQEEVRLFAREEINCAHAMELWSLFSHINLALICDPPSFRNQDVKFLITRRMF